MVHLKTSLLFGLHSSRKFYYNCYLGSKKNENNKKESGIGPFLKRVCLVTVMATTFGIRNLRVHFCLIRFLRGTQLLTFGCNCKNGFNCTAIKCERDVAWLGCCCCVVVVVGVFSIQNLQNKYLKGNYHKHYDIVKYGDKNLQKTDDSKIYILRSEHKSIQIYDANYRL